MEFTLVQKSYIESFMDLFCAELDNGVEGTALTKWKQDTANQILDSPLFVDLDLQVNPKKKWHEMVVRKFTNYRTQVYLKRNPTSETSRSSRKGIPLLHFSSLLTARQFFARDNNAGIHSEASTRLASAGGVGTLGALYQTVLKEKWNALDEDSKEGWQSKAEKFAGNIEQNQKDFCLGMQSALGDLCQGGLLGDAEVLMFYAFRDAKGDLDTGTLHAHSVHNKINFGGTKEELWHSYGQPWYQFAENAIPRHSQAKALSLSIPVNTNGAPVFPSIDTGTVTVMDVRYILVEYFKAVWIHSVAPTDPIPWDNVATAPHLFYDTTIFRFPVPLCSPTNLSNVHVLQVAEFLNSTSSFASTSPFVFKLEPHKNSTSTMDIISPGPPVVTTASTIPPVPPSPSKVAFEQDQQKNKTKTPPPLSTPSMPRKEKKSRKKAPTTIPDPPTRVSHRNKTTTAPPDVSSTATKSAKTHKKRRRYTYVDEAGNQFDSDGNPTSD
ncbi:hypothetical protein B0H11DRAFT_2049476 [Mycena galericulata]|nr:hypothetical protein B0H11DRAFT_2049476 [Mycena galericulata]